VQRRLKKPQKTINNPTLEFTALNKQKKPGKRSKCFMTGTMADSILLRKFGGSLINSFIHSNLSICNSTSREQNKPHGNNKKKTKDLDEK
jgi:hypothetical protein